MSDYFGPQTPPGTVFSNTSGSVSWRDGSGPKDKAVLRGEPFRKYAVEAILLDLIAELRDDAQSARALGGDLMDRTRVLSRLDRAEARLREIGGDDADV